MSTEQLLLILMFVGVFVGIFTGHYIAFVLGGLAVIFGFVGWGTDSWGMFANRIYGAMDDYVLVAIPLFLFMAQFLERSGVTDDLFEALRYIMGPIPGGIALTVVVVSAIFAACTGIVGASVVSMGLLAMPVLLKYKYSKEMSCGVVAAGGSLGILIPPSIMLVVMASQTGISVGKLYAGAMMPGILLAFGYFCWVLYACIKDPTKGHNDYEVVSSAGISYHRSSGIYFYRMGHGDGSGGNRSFFCRNIGNCLWEIYLEMSLRGVRADFEGDGHGLRDFNVCILLYRGISRPRRGRYCDGLY